MDFMPDYRNIVDAAKNIRPKRLPLYEHIINTGIMEKIFNESMIIPAEPTMADINHHMAQVCKFFKEMTYDTVSWEGGGQQFFPAMAPFTEGKQGLFKAGPILKNILGKNCRVFIGKNIRPISRDLKRGCRTV